MITVIITTCKREPAIVKRAINSIISQTYKEWELIVVDDSPEDFEQRSEVYQSVIAYSDKYNVKYIQNEKNSGACFSRNVGMNMAQGEYIAFLDDDDEWLPEKLEEQLKTLQKESDDTALVYGPYIVFNEITKEKSINEIPERNGMLYKELLSHGNFVGGLSMPMMKTKCIKEIGGFDEEMPAVQDMDLWLRLSQLYRFKYMAKPYVVYHVHNGEQITSNPVKKIAGLERLMNKNRAMLEKNKTIHARYCRSLAMYHTRAGNKKNAYILLFKAIRLCPLEIGKNVRCFYGMISDAITFH